MSDMQPFASLRIPASLLTAVDSRGFHYALQPMHYLVRLAHIVGMALFFGGVAMLDLRLLGWGRALPFRPVAENVLPYLCCSFTTPSMSAAMRISCPNCCCCCWAWVWWQAIGASGLARPSGQAPSCRPAPGWLALSRWCCGAAW
jgi:hypothetical protein